MIKGPMTRGGYHTFNCDNGREFADHAAIITDLEDAVYLGSRLV